MALDSENFGQQSVVWQLLVIAGENEETWPLMKRMGPVLTDPICNHTSCSYFTNAAGTVFDVSTETGTWTKAQNRYSAVQATYQLTAVVLWVTLAILGVTPSRKKDRWLSLDAWDTGRDGGKVVSEVSWVWE